MSCEIILSQDHDGRRLDRTIRSIWPALPLSAVMRALRKGEARLDGVRAHSGDIRVTGGARLYVPWEEPGGEAYEQKAKTSNTRAVPIIWRGENTLVIDKPAGLLVQPDVKHGDSVITRVWGMFGAGEQGFSPAAVHRLDRNTTGALLVAMSGGALRELERIFRERLISKRYIAVVVGDLPKSGLIDAPLLKDETTGVVRVDSYGLTAKTRYERLDTIRVQDFVFSIASIDLLTGRTHQARVHLAHIGHPILGDGKYGRPETNRRMKKEVKRPLLHAYELAFPKNLTGDLTEVSGQVFRSEIPLDMKKFMPDSTKANG
ncbi:RNA pseudouridine synthase [Synergistales bacterium]|nr:RNA pseudouridine synthase [Synergistales bacterium]